VVFVSTIRGSVICAWRAISPLLLLLSGLRHPIIPPRACAQKDNACQFDSARYGLLRSYDFSRDALKIKAGSWVKIGSRQDLTRAEPFALLTSRIDPQNKRAGLSIHGIEKLGDLHHHLSSLAHHELFALQSCQMLGNSWPRGADQVGDVLVAEGHAQQRAPRFLDSKVRAQFQQRDGYSFVEAKVQKTRAAQQEAVPLLQIVAVKLFEGGLRSIWGNAAEIRPVHSSNAAIVVSLALKTGLTERQRWEFRNRSRRQHRYRDTLVARVAAGDPRNSC
jgi:hypothetical protein